MFKKLIAKLETFGDTHQTLIAFLIALGLICFTWGVEKMMEHYIFPNRPLLGYLIAITVGLFLLWLTKHLILHVL